MKITIYDPEPNVIITISVQELWEWEEDPPPGEEAPEEEEKPRLKVASDRR